MPSIKLTAVLSSSFVSGSVEKMGHIIPQYVEFLAKEIEDAAEITKTAGLRLRSVYFGGGTPTTLSAEQLTALFRAVESSFDLSTVREYTVEAGRPDTVTPEKMAAIHAAGVGRVSINPQTLQPAVLAGIGRKHTVEQFYDAFEMARKAGFTNINTDLIAGLPGDDYAGFLDTMDRILALDPESVTVHTLSMNQSVFSLLPK